MKTLQRPTSDLGAEEWTSLLADFRASLSVMPGSEEARRMTAISGRQCIVPSMKSSPLGLWLRTLLESSRWSSRARFLRWQVQPLFSTRLTTFEDDTNCERPLPCNASAQTLKVTDMPSSRCLFRLVPSEPPHRRDRVFIVARRVTADTEHLRLQHDSGRGEQAADIGTQSERGQDVLSESIQCAETVGKGRTSADTQEQSGERIRPRQSETGESQQVESGRGSGEDGGQQTFADYLRERLQGWNDSDTQGHGQSSDGCSRQPCEVSGRERNVADTCDAGLQEARPEQPTAGHRGFDVRTGEWVERFGSGDEIGSRWANFPSVSPVHRGNDGLPFDVGRLTLSFGKWRTEALKAYGNAIVPQVMYEIFRAIEITESNERF